MFTFFPQLSDMQIASPWRCCIDILKHILCPYVVNSETLV